MALDVDRLLDARPACAARAGQWLRVRVDADAQFRRRALTLAAVVWQLGEWVAPRRQIAGVRRVLLAMVALDSAATYVWVSTGIAVEGNPLVAGAMDALGDGPALVLRALWSGTLVLMLCWLAERRAAVRPALVLVLAVLGAVTLVHAAALGLLWTALLT